MRRARFAGIGRLAAGVTPATAQAVADTVSARMQAATPLPGEPFWDIWLTRKNVSEVDDSTRTALFVLLGAVGFVLLITCANTASLFLSQVGIRQREMAVRAAIGARRAQLFREVLTESVLIALVRRRARRAARDLGRGHHRGRRAARPRLLGDQPD